MKNKVLLRLYESNVILYKYRKMFYDTLSYLMKII